MKDASERLAGERRRNAAAALVACLGLALALAVYLTAAPTDDLADRLPETKRSLREMETYAGASNVLATKARLWLEGLWQGRARAGTIACLALAAAGIVFVAMTPLPPDDDTA